MIATASADCTMRMGRGRVRRVGYPIANATGRPTNTATHSAPPPAPSRNAAIAAAITAIQTRPAARRRPGP